MSGGREARRSHPRFNTNTHTNPNPELTQCSND